MGIHSEQEKPDSPEGRIPSRELLVFGLVVRLQWGLLRNDKAESKGVSLISNPNPNSEKAVPKGDEGPEDEQFGGRKSDSDTASFSDLLPALSGELLMKVT